jgi:putative DNA primase/helicase
MNIEEVRPQRFWEFDWAGGKARHHRIDHPDGSKKMWWTPKGVRPTELLYAPLEGLGDFETALIVEGEKAADAAAGWAIAAVYGTVCGAGSTPSDAVLKPIAERYQRIVLWPDADQPGRDHMNRIGERLLALGGKDVRVIEWPDAPPGGDAADFPGSVEEAQEMLDAARPFEAKSTLKQSSSAATGVAIPFVDIQPEAIRWLWADRIACGKLNLLVGDPGLGKSWAALSIAATVSVGGTFCDGAECEPGNALIVSAEDGAHDTLRPRLDAQGADVRRVHLFRIQKGEAEQQFDIGQHLDELRRIINEVGDVRLVVIDPLTAYLGDINPNADAEVRRVLTPLAALADQTRAAFICVMHLNKSSILDVIYRVTGSVAFIGQARAAWAVVRDPNDENRRLMLKLKSNLSRADVPGLAFAIVERNGIPVLEWDSEPVRQSINEVMNGFPIGRRGPRPDKLDAAKNLIREALADGQPHPSRLIVELAKARGISYRTLKDAADALGVIIQKDKFAGGWNWQLNSASSAGPLFSQNNSATSTKPFAQKYLNEVAGYSAPSTGTHEDAEKLQDAEFLKKGEVAVDI